MNLGPRFLQYGNTLTEHVHNIRGVQHEGKGRERVGHQKHAHKNMFVVFDTKGRQRMCRTPEHVLVGMCSSFQCAGKERNMSDT